MRVSVSRIGVYQQCPRRFRYEYIDKRIPIRDTRPLVVGSAWHAALERYLEGGMPGAVEYLTSTAAELTEEETCKLCALLSRYRFDHERYAVVEPEHHFVTETGVPGFELQGYIDAVLKDKITGHRVVMEHKTTGEAIHGYSPYRKRLQVDLQVSAYMLATGASYCVYDVVRKPTLKLRKNEDPADYQRRLEERFDEQRDEHFQVWEIHRSADELEEAREDIRQTCAMIQNSVTHGLYPRATRACKGNFGWCPYIDVCSGNAELDDDTRFREKTHGQP